MIQTFGNQGTDDVFDGQDTKAARRVCPQEAWKVARRKLEALNAADGLQDLRVPPGNHLEALRGDREGQHSMRVNDQYRVCFRWTDDGPADVEITDFH